MKSSIMVVLRKVSTGARETMLVEATAVVVSKPYEVGASAGRFVLVPPLVLVPTTLDDWPRGVHGLPAGCKRGGAATVVAWQVVDAMLL